MSEMKDYLMTKEAQETAWKYADIINASRTETEESLCKHPRMPLDNRAKIFSPFAALRGYEQKIASEGMKTLRVEKQIMSEEETEKLSFKLSQVVKGMMVTVIYFQGDEREDGASQFGFYQEISGKVEKIDAVESLLRISGKIIPFSDIQDVSSETILSFDDENRGNE